MSQSSDDTFPKFKGLPTEIRMMIWALAHQDSQEAHSAGVCIINRPMPPSNGAPAIDPGVPCVDISFPHLMHTCADSRASVFSVQSNVKFRWSPDAGCNIACRELDPELDTVYLSHTNFDATMAQIDYFGGHEPRIRNVAIDACILVGLDSQKITSQVMPKFPRLRKVKIVLESDTLGVKAQSPFAPPTQRFKLVQASKPIREIQRWMLHLRLQAHRRGPGMPGMGFPPHPNSQGTMIIITRIVDIKPYVFHTAVHGEDGQTLWKKHPRTG